MHRTFLAAEGSSSISTVQLREPLHSLEPVEDEEDWGTAVPGFVSVIDVICPQ
jgi:hypothetical protein